jgi:hypothetical protein
MLYRREGGGRGVGEMDTRRVGCCVLCTYVNRREQDIELWLHHPLTAPKNGGPTEYVMGAALGQRDKLFSAQEEFNMRCCKSDLSLGCSEFDFFSHFEV